MSGAQMGTRPSPDLRISGVMLTHVGRRRRSNEDSVAFVLPAEGTPENRIGFLAVVADGMGGHAAGEVASALATEIVRRVVYSVEASPSDALRKAFAAANEAILAHSDAHLETTGMGTTCTAILIHGGFLWLGHVGDSRAYILRAGKLHQLSRDQTLHAQLIRDGVMTAAEASMSPGRNLLLQALGTKEELSPQIWTHGLPLRSGDILLLCSDGLYIHVDDARIASVLRAFTADEACNRLIEAALEGGGFDNVSVGVFALAEAAKTRRSGQAATRPIEIEANTP